MNIVFIGGFASNTAQLRYVQKELEAYFGCTVKAYSLRYAFDHPDAIAGLCDGAVVITHSAGVLGILGCTPQSLWVIAPPRVETKPGKLLGRSVKKTVILWHKALSSRQRLTRVTQYHARATREVLLHLEFYIKLLQKITLFDLIAAIEILSKNTQVYVAHMTRDTLFNEAVDQFRTPISSVMIEGEHDEILLYPRKVVEAANIRASE